MLRAAESASSLTLRGRNIKTVSNKQIHYHKYERKLVPLLLFLSYPLSMMIAKGIEDLGFCPRSVTCCAKPHQIVNSQGRDTAVSHFATT